MYLTVPIPVNRLKAREITVQPWDPKAQRIKVGGLKYCRQFFRLTFLLLLGRGTIQSEQHLCGHQEESGRHMWNGPSDGKSQISHSSI